MSSGSDRNLLLRLKVLGVFLFAFFVSNSRGASLSEESIFYRCYAQLTGERPAPGLPLLASVRNRTLTGVAACKQVLDKANLGSDGLLANTNDPEARAVLKNFYQFHRLWFEETSFEHRPEANYFEEFRWLDETESALYLTRTLFAASVPYREVVTGGYGVRGWRTQASQVQKSPASQRTPYNETPIANSNVGDENSFVGLQRGDLIGIHKYVAAENSTWRSDLNQVLTHLIKVLGNGTEKNPDVEYAPKRNYGAGIIGLHSFVSMNSGFMSHTHKANGADIMQRRWAKNSMQLLCRPLPSLRLSDVTSLVNGYNVKNLHATVTIPFRESTSCMKCHATIDPMAALTRNMTYSITSADADGNGRDKWYIDPMTGKKGDRYNDEGIMIKDMTPTLANTQTEYTLNPANPNFYLMAPNGHLRYRSFDGTKIWEDIDATSTSDALQKLGLKLQNSRDLYACAAKKYLEFFTGIDANLDDIGDIDAAPISTEALAFRNLAVSLGDSLQQHQSLKRLIYDIMDLDLYKKRDFRNGN